MIRECPRCLGPMDYELGPDDEPDGGGNVMITEVHRCRVCCFEVAVHREPWAETEIRAAVAEIRKIQSLAGFDERNRQLAQDGFEWGRRPC